jgi:signal transduction histidine kinase/HAMP domain-containing protein
MRRFKIGTRLNASFFIIVLLMFLGGAVALWQFNKIDAHVQRLQRIDQEAIAVSRVHNSVLTLKDELQRLVEVQDTGRFADEALALREDFIGDVDQAIHTVGLAPMQDQDRARLLSELRAIRASLSAQVDSMIELARGDSWLAVQLRLGEQVLKTSQRTQNLVQEINTRVSQEQALAQENVEQVRWQASALVLATGLLTLLAAGGLGLAVTRSIAHPLSHLDSGAQALAQGRFDHHILVSGGDELAHLSRVFNAAAAQLADLYASLEQKVSERTQQLETSIAVGQRITSILDLNTLLTQVTQLITERYGYYYVGIFLLDESGARLYAGPGAGEARQALAEQGFSVPIGPGSIIGWVAQNRRPLCVDDVSQDERFLYVDAIPHTQSELALPLEMGGRLLGVLDMQSDRVEAFHEGQVPVFRSLADQVAIAIQNASLYQGERSRRRLAETLHRVERALTGTLDLTKVLDLILERLAEIVAYDRACVLLRLGDELEIVAARGFCEASQPLQFRVLIPQDEQDVFRQIYRTQRPVTVPDVAQLPDWQHIAGSPPARAWLGVPLIHSDDVIGMLSITRETPTPYSDEDAALAATFAGQAAIALENAHLYAEITRMNRGLEDVVRERTQALQAAYKQLEQLDRTKSDFISVASHELRTPLTTLRGYSQMLLDNPRLKDSDSYQQLVAGIHTGALRMQEVVNSMLDMLKIDSRALSLYPEPLSIPFLLQSLCEEFGAALAERDLTLALEDMGNLPPIEADPDALRKVFYHLVSNAIKFTPDDGTITISGRSLDGDAGRGVEIVVSDTGIGIDPQFHELIFTKFYQTGQVAFHSSGQTKFKGGGPGLGLAIARGIVQAHGGRLWVESPGCEEGTCPGSKFYVLLPLRQKAGRETQGPLAVL